MCKITYKQTVYKTSFTGPVCLVCIHIWQLERLVKSYVNEKILS